MAEQLKIVIDADVVKAIGGLDKLEKHFKSTENSAKSFGVNIAKGTSQATAALAKVPNTSNAATQSLINLSRVAQDAPFGFLGIANNLNPLLESFQRLKAESKATGTSLKTNLLSALTGPAGIGLALGVGSSLLISFGDDLLRLITPSKALSDALDKAAESLTKNVGQVTVYVEALKSGTLTTAETKKVQKELIDQAPEFQSAFKGNAVNVEELDRILATKYIPQIVKSIKVTAAFGIVNEKLAESIKQIAKGGTELSTGQKFQTFISSFSGLGAGLNAAAESAADNVKKAQENLTSDSISKLIENTFKALGITFSDAASTITTGGKKVAKSIDSINAEILARARQFTKEFGDTFVLPDLEETFFRGKKQLLPIAKKLLDNVAKGDLKIKIPVQTDFEFLPEGTPLSKEQLDDLTKNFFKDLQGVPVDIVIDPTLGLNNIKLIEQKIKLKDQFEKTFGDLGAKVFGKINFDNLAKGIETATEKFADMKAVLDTLTSSVSEGLASAFNGVFDAILEGKSVFKALGEGVKALVVDTIKAIVKMLILKAVIKALSSGTSAVGSLGGIIGGAVGGTANGFNLGGAVGGRSFQNTLQVVVTGQISGSTINLAGQRAAISNSRGG